MAIYLVQHGKSVSKEVDPEKGLSPDGTAEVERIAMVAKGYQVQVSSICHSGKKRALQTAEIFAKELNPKNGVQAIKGIAPLDDVRAFAEQINPDENIMYVGHLPFMQKLTSYLITANPDQPIFKFQNGGIVCLDKDPDLNRIVIKWTLMPNIG